jgi:phosphatidylglycerol---prolipoprotein diacylglyceryl transferase
VHPILFHLWDIPVYSYGFMIAVGIVAGVSYLSIVGKKEVGLTFDQANALFLFIFFAAVAGGKCFLFLEEPSRYLSNVGLLFTGQGFVFYGSFLFAVPVMLWFFRKNQLNSFAMLDVMAVTTCLVHVAGRIGCFLAGCCYGIETNSFAGVIYTDPMCAADPKGVPLHPTQLYEAGYIALVMCFLLFQKKRKKFDGQLFLFYLIFYPVGRFFLEFFRGDEERGYVIKGVLTHSQLISVLILLTAVSTYFYLRKRHSPQSALKNRQL